ncbi:collagen alpha-1(III) chain-like [Monodelphis domestica]|uniref:collagen alpha-1(III) chain-like n=1 Tax=Monodelphis domestica TaxID=13616 RepID=UPI0024E2255C|nr:collagen alpha-1(III) chain-like [Monodelphis domestica]
MEAQQGRRRGGAQGRAGEAPFKARPRRENDGDKLGQEALARASRREGRRAAPRWAPPQDGSSRAMGPPRPPSLLRGHPGRPCRVFGGSELLTNSQREPSGPAAQRRRSSGLRQAGEGQQDPTGPRSVSPGEAEGVNWAPERAGGLRCWEGAIRALHGPALNEAPAVGRASGTRKASLPCRRSRGSGGTEGTGRWEVAPLPRPVGRKMSFVSFSHFNEPRPQQLESSEAEERSRRGRGVGSPSEKVSGAHWNPGPPVSGSGSPEPGTPCLVLAPRNPGPPVSGSGPPEPRTSCVWFWLPGTRDPLCLVLAPPNPGPPVSGSGSPEPGTPCVWFWLPGTRDPLCLAVAKKTPLEKNSHSDSFPGGRGTPEEGEGPETGRAAAGMGWGWPDRRGSGAGGRDSRAALQSAQEGHGYKLAWAGVRAAVVMGPAGGKQTIREWALPRAQATNGEQAGGRQGRLGLGRAAAGGEVSSSISPSVRQSARAERAPKEAGSGSRRAVCLSAAPGQGRGETQWRDWAGSRWGGGARPEAGGGGTSVTLGAGTSAAFPAPAVRLRCLGGVGPGLGLPQGHPGRRRQVTCLSCLAWVRGSPESAEELEEFQPFGSEEHCSFVPEPPLGSSPRSLHGLPSGRLQQGSPGARQEPSDSPGRPALWRLHVRLPGIPSFSPQSVWEAFLLGRETEICQDSLAGCARPPILQAVTSFAQASVSEWPAWRAPQLGNGLCAAGELPARTFPTFETRIPSLPACLPHPLPEVAGHVGRAQNYCTCSVPRPEDVLGSGLWARKGALRGDGRPGELEGDGMGRQDIFGAWFVQEFAAERGEAKEGEGALEAAKMLPRGRGSAGGRRVPGSAAAQLRLGNRTVPSARLTPLGGGLGHRGQVLVPSRGQDSGWRKRRPRQESGWAEAGAVEDGLQGEAQREIMQRPVVREMLRSEPGRLLTAGMKVELSGSPPPPPQQGLRLPNQCWAPASERTCWPREPAGVAARAQELAGFPHGPRQRAGRKGIYAH